MLLELNATVDRNEHIEAGVGGKPEQWPILGAAPTQVLDGSNVVRRELAPEPAWKALVEEKAHGA